jgi:hypothetical protein
MARADGVDERKLKEAVMTGQYVKDQPANMMKEFADKLLGTHLSGRAVTTEGGCPLSREPEEGPRREQEAANVSCGTGGCGCSAPQK